MCNQIINHSICPPSPTERAGERLNKPNLIMEKKSNTTGITKSFAKKMESISPFELKNRLIDMADESVKKMAHTMLNAGRGNPKFEKLYPLITYLKIPADKIFYPDSNDQKPNLQKLLTLINDCTEQEANDLLPMVRYLLELLRKQDNPTL